MDCFVKGEYDNGFLSRPSVMLEVRSSRNVIHERRDEKAWPLPGTSWNQLYLGLSGLDGEPPTRSTELSYDCEYGRISLDYLFDQDTEVTGEMKLRLWVEARGRPGQSSVPHDLTLFVAIDKLGANGQPIRFNESIGYIDDWVTRGFCRVSRHALDPIHSKPWLPFAEAGAHDFLEAITETDAVLEGAAGIAQAGGGVEAGLAVGRKARVDLDLLRRYRRRNEPDRDEKWKRSREHASHAVFSCDLGRGSKGEQMILIQIR
ncbi:Xaa-Pro dipeptidyl-peptidase, C-terminal [Fusarium oxysporum f. sp. vasinfectum]|nr:Xaa-Pro dipeptidyl-peptidase, C-terminal [Fusarium oxysporum f. sp. vasinfectum]